MTDMRVVDISNNSDCDNILENAKGQYHEILILGYDKDGNFDPRCSANMTSIKDINLMIDRFKHKLISGDYSEI